MSSKNKTPSSVAVDLLKNVCDEYRREPMRRGELWLYLCLIVDGTSKGWSEIDTEEELAKTTGLSEFTVKDLIKGLTKRGLIKLGALIPTKDKIHERALEFFHVVYPEFAKKNGYKPVTYGYRDHERDLLNALLVQNFGQPVVVVAYDLKEDSVMELWRHKDSLARYSQADEVALGGSEKFVKVSK